MALPMSRPFKHPKTGVYYFRKAVPDDLREVLGKREVKVSLGTKDAAEAKLRHAVKAADVTSEWATLRDRPGPLPFKTIIALAGEVYRDVVGVSPDEPGSPDLWARVIEMHEGLATAVSAQGTASLQSPLSLQPPPLSRLENWLGPTADAVLTRHRLRADDASRSRLLVQSNTAIIQAAQQRQREAQGDFRPDPEACRFPPVPSPKPAEAAPRVRITQLLESWAAERKPVASTLRTWTGYVGEFVTFVGHDDARRVTKADVVGWKTSLVEAGKLSAKTINEGRLAAVAKAFAWGSANMLVIDNPAKGVKVATKKGQKSAVRGYSDAEASTILRAARAQPKRSLRWLPWLSALCGGRIAELANIRGIDLTEADGLWALHISPEAGPLKTAGSERTIPLHPALVAEGFPAAVRASGPGPFFTDLFLAGGEKEGTVPSSTPPPTWASEGHRGAAAAHYVGRWIRNEVGITDPTLAPNHSWRHRFRTLGHRHGMSEAAIDAVEGHAPKTQGQRYGEKPIELLRELERIPHPLGET